MAQKAKQQNQGKKKRQESSSKQISKMKRPVFKSKIEGSDDDMIYDEVDRFHRSRDKINLDASEPSEESDEDNNEEAVFDLNVDTSDSNEDEEEEENEQQPAKKGLKSKIGAESDDEDDDEEETSAKGWGRSKRTYYSADTADLEIGQDLQDALDEEEAALELQKQRLKMLDVRDFEGSDSSSGEDEEENKDKTLTIGAQLAASQKRSKRTQNGLQQSIQATTLVGTLHKQKAGEIEAIKVERDIDQLTSEDRLQLLLSESPELLSLLSEAEHRLLAFRDTINPLASSVTKEMGASEEGLLYLSTQQEMHLSYILFLCFYLLLKSEGESVKHHPVMGQLLEVRQLFDKLQLLDTHLQPQLEVLRKALSGQLPAAKQSRQEESAEDSPVTDGEEEDEEVSDLLSNDSMEDQKRVLLKENAEEEEARFMKKVPVTKQRKAAKSLPVDSFAADYGDFAEGEAPSKQRNIQAVINQMRQKEKKAPGIASGDTDIPFRDTQKHFLDLIMNGGGRVGDDDLLGESDLDFDAAPSQKEKKLKKQKSEDVDDEEQEDPFYKAISSMKKKQKQEKAERYKVHKLTKEPEKISELERRGASYEIIANRGLVAHKKKLNRNPRVKKRVAYKKAVIRRKGQVREMRESEANSYGGELTGIRANVSKSRKIKN